MKTAYVVHWNTNNAPGIRGFSERRYAERRVTRAGGDLKDLHEVNGIFIYWPPAMGAFPDAATLAAWEADYDAAQATERTKPSLEQRVAAMEAKARA